MEKIKNIQIKNFKSIRHQTIDDCRRINVFIGYPNVGKSNILEALSLASYLDYNNNTPLKDLCRYKELIDLFNDGDKQKDAELFIDNYVFSLRYLEKNQLDFGIIKKDHYVEKFNHVTSEILNNIRFNKEGGINFKSPQTQFEVNTISLKKYDFRSEIYPLKSNPTVLNFPFGSNLAEVIRYNSGLRRDCGELFSAYNLKLVFGEDESLIVQKQLDEFTAFQFSFSQIADTLQRLIFDKAAIATNEKTALLFEEPEAHMFPPYIKKFTTDVILDNSNQFFITTHSPYVITEFIEEVQQDLAVYVVDYNKGETIIKRLSDEQVLEVAQYGIDLFFNLEAYLDRYGQPHSA